MVTQLSQLGCHSSGKAEEVLNFKLSVRVRLGVTVTSRGGSLGGRGLACPGTRNLKPPPGLGASVARLAAATVTVTSVGPEPPMPRPRPWSHG